MSFQTISDAVIEQNKKKSTDKTTADNALTLSALQLTRTKLVEELFKVDEEIAKLNAK